MKVTKQETKTYTNTVTTGYVCDLCKKEYDDNWNGDQFEEVETTVRFSVVASFPDTRYTLKAIEFHICPKCFEDRLMLALELDGVEPKWNNFDPLDE